MLRLRTIGIFACILILNPDHNKANGFEMFNGLGKRSPFVALILTICLLSLSGIPPLPGFFAKYSIFKQAITEHLWLVIIAICSSAISIYYYFRAITAMYFNKTEEESAMVQEKNYGGYVVISVALLALIVLGLFPGIIGW